MTNDKTALVVRLSHEDIEVAEKLKALHDAAYAVEARLLGLDEFPPLNRALESYANSTSAFFGYMRNGDCVGSVEIEALDFSGIEVASLVVDPRFARQGIATKLMMHVLNKAGSGRIVVSTAGANVPAIKLYEGLGFEKVDQWTTEDGLEIVQLAKSAGNLGAESER